MRCSRKIKLGDYVLAAHWSDFNPNDPWRIGFVVKIVEYWKPNSAGKKVERTYVIGEQDGTVVDRREYRHAKRISAKEGKEFLAWNSTNPA